MLYIAESERGKMETKEEKYTYGIISLFMLPLVLLSALWNTYIVWDICVLFNLTYLTQYGYEIFFGTFLVLNLVKARYKKEKDQTTKETVTEILTIWTGYLIVWLMAYFYHWLLKF